MKQTKDDRMVMKLPLVGIHRKARPNLDVAALDADVLFVAEINRMSAKFLEENPAGLFLAYRFKKPPHVNTATPATARNRSAPGGDPTKQTNGPKPGDQFERQGTLWQLFRMYETITDQGSNTIACAYFDVETAAALGQDYDYFFDLPVEHQESNFQDLDLDHLEVGHHSEIVDWIKESDLPVSVEVAEKALGSRKSTRVVPPTYAAPPKPLAKKLTRPRAKKGRPHVDAMVPWKDVAADCGGGAWHINCYRCEDESDSDSDDEYDLLHCYYCNLTVHSMCYRTTCSGPHPSLPDEWVCSPCMREYLAVH
jgi:hypothetical protein